MRNSKILFVIGAWVILLTFLGFPSNIKHVLYVLTGLLIIYLDLLISKELKKSGHIENTFENFSENGHSLEKEEEEIKENNEDESLPEEVEQVEEKEEEYSQEEVREDKQEENV
jgi:flagellar biosynthesis component FlhA